MDGAYGAGLLPYSHIGGHDCFLLADEGSVFSSCWSDFGGNVDPGETYRGAAAREAHEESRGVLGSSWEIWMRLGLWPTVEKLGRYRAYLLPLSSSHHDIQDAFHRSPLRRGAYGEVRDINWVRKEHLFKTVAGYRPGSHGSVRVSGLGRLRPRLVGIVRRLPEFQRFLERLVASIVSCRPETIGLNMSSKTVTVVHLHSGRSFAVTGTGTSPQALRLVPCIGGGNSIWSRVRRVWAAITASCFNPTTTADRNAVFAALKAESYASRLWRTLNCQFT